MGRDLAHKYSKSLEPIDVCSNVHVPLLLASSGAALGLLQHNCARQEMGGSGSVDALFLPLLFTSSLAAKSG